MLTPVFAGFFGLFYMFLTVRTIKIRRTARVAIGTGDNELLARSSRAHGNFIDYVPFALILSYFAELAGKNQTLIFVLLASLFVGRIIHFYGLAIDEMKRKTVKLRVIGMAITITTISTLSLLVIF